MGTQLGLVIRRSSRRARRHFKPHARPAYAIATLCLIGMAACSNAIPSIPVSAASSADASKAAASSGSPATDPAASGPAPSEPAGSAVTFGSFNACALLPVAQLTKIVGGEPHPTAMPVGGWIAGQCAWSSSKLGFFLSVGTASTIREAADLAAADAKAKLAEFRNRANVAGEMEAFKRIGDGAILAATGMAAYKGDAYVEVTKLKLSDDQMIKIVQLAVANL